MLYTKGLCSMSHALATRIVVVPDQHPALFEHGIEGLGSMLHRWAPMIEELVDDRVIWAYEFSAEHHLVFHAVTTPSKKWKKGRRKVEDRIWPER